MSVIDTLDDDERLKSAKDIRQEIELVEAEGRRLLDAFNGLELSTLVRQRKPGHSPLATAALLSPGADSESQSKLTVASSKSGRDPDAMSVVSSTSRASRQRSPSVTSRSKQLNPSNSAPVFQPVTLGRKASSTSLSSRHRAGSSIAQSPARYAFGSTSSVNLTGSSRHLPLATVSEHEVPYISSPMKLGDPKSKLREASSTSNGSVKNLRAEDIAALEVEMADIRRRRAEVTARYEARLEYLRARLKGAELHEKLMKR